MSMPRLLRHSLVARSSGRRGSGRARADVVELKNGGQIHGEIANAGDKTGDELRHLRPTAAGG